ncbi:MAG: hypothetical protein KIT58_13905 [Planctomycetota bacterium]|nr:hypothetical protein [Planctomycetota bacterium]
MTARREMRRRGGERGSASLVAVLGLLALAMSLALITLTGNALNVKHTGQAREDVDLHFLAMAALNQAYAEVADQADHDGDGGIGSVAPVLLTTASGAVVGEYTTYVYNTADPTYANPNQVPNYVIRATVAVPGLANPLLARTAEARVTAEVEFALRPKVGAISISGPLNNPSLTDWGSSAFSIEGGDFPGIVFTDPSAQDKMVQKVASGWFSNGLDGKVTGSPMTEFARSGTPPKFLAPFAVEQEAAFSAEMLNAYRDALRTYFQGLVSATDDGSGGVSVNYAQAAAGGVVVLHQDTNYVYDASSSAGLQPRLKQGTHTFDDDKVVLLDTSRFHQGGANLTQNHADGTGGGPATTISGKGTLVILHPVGSFSDNNNGKQFNLNWEGNVVVIGYPKDRSPGVGTNSGTDNLLYISRATWNVDGNLILLTQGNTEASLEMQGTSTNPANLTVNGSVLLFGEASTQESEIDIEAHANFTVNGLVAAFGSRIEIENQNSTNTTFKVNGTMALGFPSGSTRNDDLKWQVKGDADFVFDEQKVESAIKGLSALQSNLNLTGTQLQSLDFKQRATVTRSAATAAQFLADRQALVEASKPLGVDIDLILNTMMQ